ncbi:MAG: hypothetical protein HYV45_02870 [Candidatus Moranbacteria bacterium]|nr:hypothetical protein [Candidatus Moranbacteria bacterium]
MSICPDMVFDRAKKAIAGGDTVTAISMKKILGVLVLRAQQKNNKEQVVNLCARHREIHLGIGVLLQRKT